MVKQAFKRIRFMDGRGRTQPTPIHTDDARIVLAVFSLYTMKRDNAVHDDETRLICQARRGDPTAFTCLYDRYQLAVFTYLFFRLGDQARTEELASEVFVRMVEKIERFTHQGQPFLAWLYTIARNLLIDEYRKNGKATLLPLDESLVAQGENPDAVVEAHLSAGCLQRALCRLTDDQRQVIVGKFIEDRSNAEVARLLGKPEGAIKSLQHRALAALRRSMEEEGCHER